MARRTDAIRFLIPFFLLAANNSGAAVAQSPPPSSPRCENLFLAQVYQPPTRSAPSLITSLRPAPGSLAARDPSVTRSLVDARGSLIVADEHYLEFKDRDTLSKDLEFVAAKLHALRINSKLNSSFGEAVYLAEARLKWLGNSIAAGAKENLIESSLHQIEAQIWEIAVATQFRGAQIFLNKRLSELYPQQFKRFTKSERRGVDREIDIAILNEDGSWRWIEVKDWSLESIKKKSSRKQLVKQSYKQLNAAQKLRLFDVELVLVMKYSTMTDVNLQGSVLDDYFDATAFKHLIVLFPGASAKQRIELDQPPLDLWKLQERRNGKIHQRERPFEPGS